MEKTGTPNEYRRQLKTKILDFAMSEFIAHGIRAVKMDSVARGLGISKRTLYEIYNNKEDLLMEGIMRRDEEKDAAMHEFLAESHNVIELLGHFYHSHIEMMAGFNPVFFEDLEKYEKLQTYFEAKHQERNNRAKEFFKRGVEEGYFRSDVDIELILHFGGVVVQRAMSQKMYEKYTMQHLFHNVLLLFLRSFCTLKGVELLDQLLSENK